MRSSILVSFVLNIFSWLVYPLVLLVICCPLCTNAYEVVFAVNCGGQRHTDRYGIKYRTDSNQVGVASVFGQSLVISRVHSEDMTLYQTERYHTSSFSYDIPVDEDGDYVLITKYSEVYFQHPGGKVFDVVLNKQHTIIPNLDIFARVGKAAAHDEVTRFKILNGQLLVQEESSPFKGTLSVEFSKGSYDNPKVNAIVLLRGPVHDSELPALPPFVQQREESEDPDEDSEDEMVDPGQKFGKTSGPRAKDPYASDDSWFMPITIAVAVFLPVLFFLCRVK